MGSKLTMLLVRVGYSICSAPWSGIVYGGVVDTISDAGSLREDVVLSLDPFFIHDFHIVILVEQLCVAFALVTNWTI